MGGWSRDGGGGRKGFDEVGSQENLRLRAGRSAGRSLPCSAVTLGRTVLYVLYRIRIARVMPLMHFMPYVLCYANYAATIYALVPDILSALFTAIDSALQ